MKYIENAKIIKLEELPKINDQHPTYKDRICIEIAIAKITDDYIIYNARYCDLDSIELLDNDFFVDCAIWSYAVKKESYNRI